MFSKNKFIKFWFPVYFYAIMIFIFSSMPQLPRIFYFKYSDKLTHLVEYAIFGFLLIRAFKNSSFKLTNTQMRFLVVLLGFVYGITDEAHQYFVPGRFVSTADIIFDGIGTFIGQFIPLKHKITAKTQK